MNPLRWIRWKVLAALIALGLILYFLGIDPLAHMQVNRLGAESSAARWHVGDLDLGLLAGDLELDDLLVAASRREGARSGKEPAAGEAKDDVLRARGASFDLSVGELLRRRFVVDRIELTGPRMRIERRPDGSTNIGDLGEEAGEEEPPGESTDWVGVVKKWYERIQKIREKLPSRDGKEEEESEAERKKETTVEYYRRRATYPFAGRPGFVVREIAASDLEIAFEEPGGEAIPPLEDGSIRVTGLSSKPALHDEPIGLSLSGKLAGAPVQLDLTLDFTKGIYKADLDTGDLPVSVIERFIGDSLPVRLVEGTIGLGFRAPLALDADGKIQAQPELRFRGVQLQTKDPGAKIAGMDGQRFVNAFNEASRSLGSEPLVIADLKIEGPLSHPRFEWGNTVKDLVVQGGKAFARAQLEQVKGVAGEDLKRLEGVIEGQEEALRKKLEEDAVPGAGSLEGQAKDAAERLKRGLFGGGTKKEEEGK